MNEQLIDLLVERLQGTFPTAKISPKAVIGTWRKDVFLQDFPDELGLRLRETLQDRCTTFPSLPEVRYWAKTLLPKETDARCRFCNGSGYIPEMADDAPVYKQAYAKNIKNPDGSDVLMTWRDKGETKPVLYHYVIDCRCKAKDDF